MVNMVDSYVVKGATSKGRSSSKGLSPILRRVNARVVAAAIYYTLPYVPTRWNASDDPTRDVLLRAPSGSLALDDWAEEDPYNLAELPALKKWASLWVRLTLRLLGPLSLRLADRSWFRQKQQFHSGFQYKQIEFDSSLGYPGEGPVVGGGVFFPRRRTFAFFRAIGLSPLLSSRAI